MVQSFALFAKLCTVIRSLICFHFASLLHIQLYRSKINQKRLFLHSHLHAAKVVRFLQK